MATRTPSQGRATDPVIVDAGTADPTVHATCLSSRDVTSTALHHHADGVATQRSDCFRLHQHHGGFSKGEHPTKTSSAPTSTSSHAARFHARSVVMDMDHAERVESLCRRRGCFGGLGVFKGAEHPTENSASQTSSRAAGFDIRAPVMMHGADGVASQRGGCFRLQQHHGVLFKRQLPTEENSSSPTPIHPARYDICPVILDRADSVASTQRSNIHGFFLGFLHHCYSFLRSMLARMSSFDVNTVSGTGRFKAGILMILLLIASIAGTASGRALYTSPAVCPRRNLGLLELHGHVCYTDQTLAFTKAMSSADPAPPTQSTSGKVNLGCRYTADVLLILACLAPWYSILNFQQTQGISIKFFCWRTKHLIIWKFMAVSSIFYYMAIMLYGLTLANLSEKRNIVFTNGICGCIFVILLVFLLSRHKTFYKVTCEGAAAVGGLRIIALAFTIPLNLACAKLFSGNSAIQGKIFGILALLLMVIMHSLRWLVVNLSWWFLFFNLSGIVSGFLWFCNRDGDTLYSWVIVGGALARTIELVTSAVWKCRGESPFIRRTRIIEAGIHLSDRTQYMMDRMRQL